MPASVWQTRRDRSLFYTTRDHLLRLQACSSPSQPSSVWGASTHHPQLLWILAIAMRWWLGSTPLPSCRDSLNLACIHRESRGDSASVFPLHRWKSISQSGVGQVIYLPGLIGQACCFLVFRVNRRRRYYHTAGNSIMKSELFKPDERCGSSAVRSSMKRDLFHRTHSKISLEVFSMALTSDFPT